MSEMKMGAEAPKKRGRPKKAATAANSSTPKKRGRPKKTTYNIAVDKDLNVLPKIYKCTSCGKMTMNPTGKFYRNQKVPAFEGNDGHTFICSDCVQKLLDLYKREYGSEKLAVFLVCVQTGHYFNEMLYETMVSKGESAQFGKYLRQMNNPQWGGEKTILNNFFELNERRSLFLSETQVQTKLEGNWKLEDRKNMVACIRQVGHDPFAGDAYTSADRKYLFNTLSRYLADETVLNDPHKLTSVIEIVKLQLQVAILQERTVNILRSSVPDNSLYKNLTETLARLNDTITRIAKANSITADSRSVKSAKTFTGVIDEMLKSGMLEAKTNVADVKMDEAFKSIAEISHKALLQELHFTGDEYARMVAEQAEKIHAQQIELIALREELRVLKLEQEIVKNPKQYQRTRFENNEVFYDMRDNGLGEEPDVEQILSDLAEDKQVVDDGV